MTSNSNDKFDDLRQKAEKLVGKSRKDKNSQSNEVLELIHELKIQQAELEVQNDELEIANEKLASMHREYADLYEHAPCGFVTLSPKGIFEHINLKAASLLNLHRGPLTFMAFSSFIAPESEAEYFNALKRIGKTGQMQQLELRLKDTQNNPVKWLHVNIHAETDENGLMKRWQLSLDDITRRKEAEEALQQARENLHQVQRIAGIGDVIWYIQTGEIIWSDSMFDLLGYDKTEKFNYARVNSEIHHPEDRKYIEQWIEESLESGCRELPPLEYRVIRADGRVLYIWGTGLIEYEDEKPFRITITLQDITSDKENEKKMLEAIKLNKDLLLELQHRAKNSFMTISSMIKIARHDCVSDETAVVLDDLYARVKAVFELYNMIYLSGSV
ncbi:MAG: PAS domain S-box protein, partial [Spirochaetota bacterium]